MAVTLNANTSTGFIATSDTSGVLQLQTGGTAAVTVDASQQVGIGTASPGYKLDVSGVVSSNDTVRVTSGTTVTIMSTAGGGEGVVGTSSNHALQFRTNNTERMRVNAGAPILCLSGGNTSATGTGIAFPATQSVSSDANTLDDYEEGTWTPAVRGAGTAGTYTPTTADGTYTKVGRLVTASFRIVGLTTASGGTGYMQITGLPFTNAGFACGSVRFQSLVIAASAVIVDIEFIAASGTTILNFFESYNNASGQDTPISSVSTSTNLFGTITFSAQ